MGLDWCEGLHCSVLIVVGSGLVDLIELLNLSVRNCF